MKNPIYWLTVGATVTILTVAVSAATVTVEPDDYTGDMTGVAPGARLLTVRDNGLGTGYVHQKVYSVAGGSWAPTGRRVFGHSAKQPGELAYHWDNIGGVGSAWDCHAFGDCGEFKVFGVYFRSPVSVVKVRTTMRGEQAMDPVELWAFNSHSQPILKCRVNGVDNEVLESGVLPPPTYYNLPSHLPCGEVLEKKNCNAQPGDCDHVVEMRLLRKAGDIAFVWFGGSLYGNTHANVDALTYVLP